VVGNVFRAGVAAALLLAASVCATAAPGAEAKGCSEPGEAPECPIRLDLGAAIGASATIAGQFRPGGPTELNYRLAAETGETLTMRVSNREPSPGLLRAALSCAGEPSAMPIATIDNAFNGETDVGGLGEATAEVRVKASGPCLIHVQNVPSSGGPVAGAFTLALTRAASEIRPIDDMRVLLIGAETGRLHELSQSDGFANLTLPGKGREAADSYLVDVKLEGPPDSRWPNADLAIEVYSVFDGRNGERDSKLIARRKVKAIAFGADGVRHEDVFVDGGLCGQIAVYAEVQKPTLAGVKALMPFECHP
jgi:hypothetical protein